MKTLLFLIAGTLSLQAQTGVAQVLPVVDLVYPRPDGTVFDTNCLQMSNTTLDPAAVKAAVERTPEFQQLVNRELRPYLSLTYEEVGMPFPYREVQAALTVCRGIHSMSSPLILNVGRYLPTAQNREPDWYFVEQAYHELMHTYAGPAVATSELARKYASEDRVTLYHLHVMALEKFVLVKLNRTEELNHVGELYGQPPAYKRAWEIVDKLEDYRAFIKELKVYAARGH